MCRYGHVSLHFDVVVLAGKCVSANVVLVFILSAVCCIDRLLILIL